MLNCALIVKAPFILTIISIFLAFMFSFESFHARQPGRYFLDGAAYLGIMTGIAWIAGSLEWVVTFPIQNSLAGSFPSFALFIVLGFVSARFIADGAKAELEKASAVSLIAAVLTLPFGPDLLLGVASGSLLFTYLLLVAGPVVIDAFQARKVETDYSDLSKEVGDASNTTMLSHAESVSRVEKQLRGLSDGHSVLNRMSLPKTGEVDHVVVGPMGVTLLRTVQVQNVPDYSAKHGWKASGADLGLEAGVLLEQRLELSKRMRLHPDAISLMFVFVTPEDSVGLSETAVVFALGEKAPKASIRLTTLNRLIEALDWGVISDTPSLTRQALWRARRALRGAYLPGSAAGKFRAPIRLRYVLGKMTQDGAYACPQVAEEAIPEWCFQGALVDVQTSQGMLGDLRIAGDPYRGNDLVLVIPVCLDEEWEAAINRGRRPRTQIVPLTTVVPVPPRD